MPRRKAIFFSSRNFFGGEGSVFGPRSWQGQPEAAPRGHASVYLTFGGQNNLEADWPKAGGGPIGPNLSARFDHRLWSSPEPIA